MNFQPLVIAVETSGSSQPWFRVDGLAIALAATVAVLGTTVVTYARRNLLGTRGARAFFIGASGILAGTLVVALAGRLSVLVVGWLLTSASVLVVLSARGDTLARNTARRAGYSLAVGDLALLVAAVCIWTSVGDADLSEVGRVASELASSDSPVPGLDIGTVVALLLAVAALARAAQFPLHGWLPGTVNAPTPASALLHAGVVNAGGFLLVRMGPVFGDAPSAAWVLVTVSIVTILLAGGTAILRRDIKGVLATSTSAQMGFMLLAVGVGAPVAAMSHLIGHALYKSSRFLGAGDMIRRAVAHRRWTPEVREPLATPARVLLSTTGPAAGLLVGWLLVGSHVLKGADGWVLATAILVTACRAGWIWSGRAIGSSVARAATGSAVLGLIVVAYLLVATLVELLIIDSLDRAGAGYVPAPLALGLLGALVAAGLLLMASDRHGPRIRGALAAGGVQLRTAHRPSAHAGPAAPRAREIRQYEEVS